MDYRKLIRIVDASGASLDAEYVRAVEADDRRRLRQMLDEAFRCAFPDNVLGARVFYKGVQDESSTRVAGFFTDDYEFPDNYISYSGAVKEVYLVMENPYEYDFMESGSDGDFPGTDGETRVTYQVMRSADEEAEREGRKPYDGYILRDVGEGYGPGSFVVDDYIVNDPKRVKSADLVTYDDDDNIIPLSQRFNSSSDDLRY